MEREEGGAEEREEGGEEGGVEEREEGGVEGGVEEREEGGVEVRGTVDGGRKR